MSDMERKILETLKQAPDIDAYEVIYGRADCIDTWTGRLAPSYPMVPAGRLRAMVKEAVETIAWKLWEVEE